MPNCVPIVTKRRYGSTCDLRYGWVVRCIFDVSYCDVGVWSCISGRLLVASGTYVAVFPQWRCIRGMSEFDLPGRLFRRKIPPIFVEFKECGIYTYPIVYTSFTRYILPLHNYPMVGVGNLLLRVGLAC